VEEDSTPIYQCQLVDQDGNNVNKVDIITAELRVMNIPDGTTIKATTNILADISATGLLTRLFDTTDTAMKDATIAHSATEQHAAIFTMTYGNPVKTMVHVVNLYIRRAIGEP
jgi:hypothetical protein